ncbi:MAG: hypothetical protein A3C58_00340 [Candidatus Staskawiczbacteria bacterium RIFCSPHIGHO2_02_FULL_34_10]|uniref:Uncharacterized protein n=1 Tax=Candidatus Staskawiczbacteria bacterium RIFCSPHIGHO2_02_FULL_34_10 TaxID=1802205 RepID=A0A1G2HTQ2_9BACT|nr:MAG: hypothetical protein A3C58_00340 [Candidatus Staskawiczbacteria bacterium RIFCSPHIGHO2_02_FULL_34_10]
MSDLDDDLEEKFVDLTLWNAVFYYISHCIIKPSNKEGVNEKISNTISSINCSNDQEAIAKFHAFNKQEENICKSFGKVFISGSLFKIERGKIKEVKVDE